MFYGWSGKLFRVLTRERERESKHGLPIGNLTSQIFANIYLNELDQFIKHKLRIKYYLRYCDDFVILGTNRDKLEKNIPQLSDFLQSNLKLTLHPDKINIRKLKQGIDFLGYVVLPHHRVLRTKTKRRMFIKINKQNISSYLGLLKHCDSYNLSRRLKIRVKIFSRKSLFDTTINYFFDQCPQFPHKSSFFLIVLINSVFVDLFNVWSLDNFKI